MLYSGKLIRNIRTAENIKLATLARGLCSIGQLARIENGDRSAEKLLFDSLYERLGKYSGRFTVLVNFDEYEQLRKRLYIYECIDDGNYEEAQRELDRYKKHTRNHIHKQFLCLAECEIMHKTGREINECMYKLMEGISYTFADFEIEHIEEYYLSRMELTSVNKVNNPKCVDCWAVNFCKDCNWNVYKEGTRDCKARLQIIQKRLLYVYNMEEMERKRLETVMKG